MTTPAPPILGAAEHAAGHSFADPGHVESDRTMLTTVLGQFATTLHQSFGAPGPVVVHTPSEEAWQRRTLIVEPAAFVGLDVVTVVGFFGQRRHNVDPAISQRIEELSEELFLSIPGVDGVYAYVTQLLVDEFNYVNLVIVDNSDVIERWRQTAPHPVAAGTVSADYYDSVRIYNGAIPVVAMADPRALELHCVKYWDFRESPPWAAVRDLRRAGRVPGR